MLSPESKGAVAAMAATEPDSSGVVPLAVALFAAACALLV